MRRCRDQINRITIRADAAYTRVSGDAQERYFLRLRSNAQRHDTLSGYVAVTAVTARFYSDAIYYSRCRHAACRMLIMMKTVARSLRDGASVDAVCHE